MIAVDTSALLAVLLDEPEASSFARLITENDCIVGAPNRLEAWLVLRSRGKPADLVRLGMIFGLRNVETLPFGPVHLDVAQSVFSRFGKGRGHSAQLNFGDCMAYAIAKVADAPLLYKGDDFRATDIPAAAVRLSMSRSRGLTRSRRT